MNNTKGVVVVVVRDKRQKKREEFFNKKKHVRKIPYILRCHQFRLPTHTFVYAG